MATRSLSWGGFFLRALFALLLVASTYNPSGYSFSHLVLRHHENWPLSLLTLIGIGLLIGWVIYLRATLRSLGSIGMMLALGVFGALIWVMFDYQMLNLDNPSELAWIAVALVALVLAIGMSWSHLRRRMSGQIDADDVDED
ncbi:MAG: hypothetical protein KDI42_07995 [Gammaproteobacteria bacterium]|nr:hypothetical protein [Gammaproteobacteria bacterium]MCB1738050.1 hypothetical protein [Gammaproteobacteria bacterium]MCP5137030.1 hypothetical protein [Gammaproteobacteria bacterium]